MEPRIIIVDAKKLIGLKQTMSVSANTTPQLWKAFRNRCNEIENRCSPDFISLQEYPTNYFNNFNPTTHFNKWACVEVRNFETVPPMMKSFVLEGGTYAVFDYKGSSADQGIFQYIYGEWLPGSGYQLDDRPHFEVLGENYKNNDPTSEEEIWIPIRK